MSSLGDLPTARVETWRRVLVEDGEPYQYDASVEVLEPMPPLSEETVLIAYPALVQLLTIAGFSLVDPLDDPDGVEALDRLGGPEPDVHTEGLHGPTHGGGSDGVAD